MLITSLNHFDRAYKQGLLLLTDNHPSEDLVVYKQLCAHVVLQFDLYLSAVIGLYHLGILLYYGAVAGVVDEVDLGDAGRALIGGDVDDHLSASEDRQFEVECKGLNYYLLGDRDGVLE